MKRLLVIAIICTTWAGLNAGNPDRTGEAGAYELLVNSWARSSGVFGMNTAHVQGIESMRNNVGGLARTQSLEVVAAYSLWLQGSGTNIAQAGVALPFGEANVLGLSMQNVSFGEIPITTTSNPEGGLGTFNPSLLNIGLGYSRVFSNSIYGGIVFRLVNESIADLNASGFALDAGIQYVTGPKENIKFGVAIRNIGTPLKFNGDGLSFRGLAPDGDYQMTQEQRSAAFNLPSLLNIGIAYDFWFGPEYEGLDEEMTQDYRLTLMGNFTSNSVGKDFLGGGAEFAWKEMFMARVGYRYEEGITSATESTTAFTGLAAGVTVDVPLQKENPESSRLGIDYSYRPSNPWSGVHTMGIRIGL